jgi:NTE family protein
MIPIMLADLARSAWDRRKRSRLPGAQQGRRRINLALQGGGADGAFTWGALDELLGEEALEIEGISGASAGAVNAVMLADGLVRGGPDCARTRLADFWRAVSLDGHLPELQRRVVERLFPFAPGGVWLGAMSSLFSPYHLNPLNINPLKELIERFVDFEALREADRPELFISATNVHSGEPRVFRRRELTAEVVMASACLPLMFRAVEIGGVPYWDGGYSANPPLAPFLSAGTSEDVLIVQLNPRRRREVPTRQREIEQRVSEIGFNAVLLAELRGVAMVNRMIDHGRLSRGPGEPRRLRLHRIVMDDPGGAGERALARDYRHLEQLRQRGARAARGFLDAHLQDIGRRSTIDLPQRAAAAPVD